MTLTKHKFQSSSIPFDEASEQRVLGAVLLDPAKHWPACSSLTTEHFHDERNKAIFGRMLALEQDSSPIEVLTVQDCLGPEHQPYISALPDAVPPDPQLDFHIGRLHECYFVRRMQQAVKRTDAIGVLAAARTAVADFESTAQRNGLPPIQDACSPMAMSRPSELVQGILHKGSKLVIGGGSKAFKTFTLADLALSVAYGAPWLSCETERGRVLYVNLEIQEVFFHDRLMAISRAKRIDQKPDSLDVWNLRGYAADAGVLLPEIECKTKQAHYALIVLDPIYKLYGAVDENKAGDVARLLNRLEHLAVSSGAAVAFGAHFSKGNQAAKESIDRISGSGVFARDPDSLLVFTPHKEPEAFTVEPTLRNFAPVQPFVVRWEYPLMRRDGQLNPAELKQPKMGRVKLYDADEVLSVLPDTGLSATEWENRSKAECGASGSTFHRMRRELLAANRVMQSKVNGLWLPIKSK